MARTGRPPKPIEEKRRTGNPGGRPLAKGSSALVAVPAVDPEPVELEPVQTLSIVFEHARHWLAASDTTALAMLRESLEERDSLRSAVLAGHGDRKDLRALDQQIIGQLSALGFDPSARGRLGLVEVKAASKLEQLKAARGS